MDRHAAKDTAHLALDGIAPERLVGLVAHHTAGDAEAEIYSMSIALDCFPRERSAVADALVYCDLTSAPDGHIIHPSKRIEQIGDRYGPHHPVSRAIASVKADLLDACDRVERRLP